MKTEREILFIFISSLSLSLLYRELVYVHSSLIISVWTVWWAGSAREQTRIATTKAEISNIIISTLMTRPGSSIMKVLETNKPTDQRCCLTPGHVLLVLYNYISLFSQLWHRSCYSAFNHRAANHTPCCWCWRWWWRRNNANWHVGQVKIVWCDVWGGTPGLPRYGKMKISCKPSLSLIRTLAVGLLWVGNIVCCLSGEWTGEGVRGWPLE